VDGAIDTVAVVEQCNATEEAEAGASAGDKRLARGKTAGSMLALLQNTKSITGMAVRDTAAETEPTTGSVLQVFTTDTVGESSCSLAADRPGTGRRDTVRPPPRRWRRREANKTGCVIRG
jgi:hypothetical protein